MSKFLGRGNDKWGNDIYVMKFNGEEIEFTHDVRQAILLSDEDKKTVGKILKKQHRPNIKYIKLENFDSIDCTTTSALYEYKHDFYENPGKYSRKEDEMNLECIDYAKNNIDDVNTFKEFGDNVAKILIEKYNLQKKDNI